MRPYCEWQGVSDQRQGASTKSSDHHTGLLTFGGDRHDDSDCGAILLEVLLGRDALVCGLLINQTRDHTPSDPGTTIERKGGG